VQQCWYVNGGLRPSWCAACGARRRCPSVGGALHRFVAAGVVVQHHSDARVYVAGSAGGVDYSVGYVVVELLDYPVVCAAAVLGCLVEYDAVAQDCSAADAVGRDYSVADDAVVKGYFAGCGAVELD